MILKIERYIGITNIGSGNNSRLGNNDDDWWLLDDIRKISKCLFKAPFSQNIDLNEDVIILDYEEYLKKTGDGQDSRDVIRLICRLSNGDEFSVLFDTIAYILNDNGKTIEKLVANYR